MNIELSQILVWVASVEKMTNRARLPFTVSIPLLPDGNQDLFSSVLGISHFVVW
jgi:hypothetical protein